MKMRIKDFINTAFRDYADYDNQRNIPHLMDGLKISQRKIIWTFHKVLGKNEVVVDRAAMRAAEYTFYRHGGQNLYDVIVGLAQNYPGTNNMNLLEPIGQFGTIMSPDASSPRYISTKLNDNFNKLFDDDDFAFLTPLYDEGQEVEPMFLLPKLPLHLINGSKGTGNGFASTIYSYNPKDLQKAIMEYLKHGKIKTKLVPYLNGYKGLVVKDAVTKQIAIAGLIEKTNSNTLTITELPPKYDAEKYKAVLNKLIEEKLIKDYDNESTEESWKFIIDAPRTTVAMEPIVLFEKFKLIERATETLAVWLPNGRIKIYDTIEAMLTDWIIFRLEYYERRREHLIERYGKDVDWLKTKMKFITWWNTSTEELYKLKKAELKERIHKEITTDEEFVGKLLNIRVVDLSLDEVEALQKNLEHAEDMLSYYEDTDEAALMTLDIKALKL